MRQLEKRELIVLPSHAQTRSIKVSLPASIALKLTDFWPEVAKLVPEDVVKKMKKLMMPNKSAS